MVKEIEDNGKCFQCEECGFYYKTKTLAGKCEDFCKKHKACNQDIVKHAIKN